MNLTQPRRPRCGSATTAATRPCTRSTRGPASSAPNG